LKPTLLASVRALIHEASRRETGAVAARDETD
jgi:hypothetical protein